MKNKAIVCLIISLCVLFSNPIFIYAEGTTVELEANKELSTLKPGDIITVNIVAKNVNRLVGGDLIVSYDSSHMSLQSKEFKNISILDFTRLNNVSNSQLEDQPGKAKLVFGLNKSSAPLSGDHIVATLTFNILSKGNGSISVDSASTLISEDVDGILGKISFSTNAINYSVLGIGSVSGAVKNTSSEPIANASISILKDNVVMYSTSTKVDGSFDLVDICEGSYELQIVCEGYKTSVQNIIVDSDITLESNITLIMDIAGDINGDEKITLEDLVFVANCFGLDNARPEWDANASIADINKDGKIDVLDLIFIGRRLE